MVSAYSICNSILMDDANQVRSFVQMPGFDPRETLKGGVTMMHIAASSGDVEIGIILRDAGVPLNETDEMGIDVLSYAKKSVPFLEFLHASGVDLKREKSMGGKPCSLLRECVLDGLVETAEFLIKKGLVPSEEDLHFARAVLSTLFPIPENGLVELASVIAGRPSKEEALARATPHERLIRLFEETRSSLGLAIGLNEADARFLRGPQNAPMAPGTKPRMK